MNIEELLKQLPDELKATVALMNNRLVALTEENHSLRRKLFAQQSELLREKWKIIEPLENGIFNEAETLIAEASSDSDSKENDQNGKPKKQKVKSCGRKPLPLDLPREEIVHDLSDKQKICPNDGSELKQIGEERVEKLEYIPAQFKVIVDVYPKYACSTCASHVAKENVVPAVIPGAICKPGLLAGIILFKYRLGLPLFRIEELFEGGGVEIPRITLARWVIRAAEFLTPLVVLLKDEILLKKSIHADETHVQVLKEPGKTPQSKSYMWTMCTMEQDTPIVYYEYHPSRSQEAAKKLLTGFKGFLHVDAYDWYNKITGDPDVIEVNCWAHARRKFFEAYKDGEKSGQSLAEKFLKKIKILFEIEKDCKDHDSETRKKIRQERSLPVLREIRHLVDAKITSVPHKSKLGAALCYTANHWKELTAFLQHGDTALSNNRIENFIRPFVIGRKNWLFSTSVAGAEASAKLYSLVITAKENGCDVFEYLRYLFEKLPPLMDDITPKELEEFLPWNFQKNTTTK